MLGPKIGMGPVWLQQGRLHKCSERHADICDPLLTDQCCAVIPCSYCLKWEVYGEQYEFGTAVFDPDLGLWVGEIIGLEFVAYWENIYGVCYFVVKLEGEEIAKLSCDDGVTCRDSSASVEISIDYETGKLSWEKKDVHKLPYVKTDENCTDFFCGTCECTCKQMCAILKMRRGLVIFEGEDEIDLNIYSDCDGPEWLGTVPVTLGAAVDNVTVHAYLYRDVYTGECWIAGSVEDADGVQELTPTKLASDCKLIDVTFILYDGSIVRLKCKDCGCRTTEYCRFCCLPMDFSIPEYPSGVIKDIPFSFTGCTPSGGGEGVFKAQPGNEPCTTEVTFTYADIFGTAAIPMYYIDLPNAFGCPTTPCSNSFTFVLECTARFLQPGDDEQCSRVWLWIGSLLRQVGDIGETPGANPQVGWSWKKVRASGCTCDPVGGLAATIPFDITVDCSDAAIGYNGDCAGKVLNCCEVSCSGVLFI